MEPVERLAHDLQELKKRFDDMSLRFAISEEREKRVDDKLDNITATMNVRLGSFEKSLDGWSTTVRWAMFTLGGVLLVAVGKWIISGSLAGL